MTQTRKVLLQLAAMVLIAGGIGAYAWFGIFKPEESKKRQDDHDLRLFAPQKLDERQADGGSPPADWTHVVVTTGDLPVTLERIGKDWVITSPVRARADKLVVDGLLSQLQNSKFKGVLDDAPDASMLKTYELVPPHFVVAATATVNGQVRSVKLTGGAENRFDGTVYVQRDDEPAVYAAEGGVRFMLAKSLYDLREKMVLALDESSVRSLEVKTSNNRFTVERDGESKMWNLTAPEREPADAPSIVSMISGAASEKAQQFFDDTEINRRELLLETPLVDVKATLLDGGTVRLRGSKAWRDGGVPPYGDPAEIFVAMREDSDGVAIARVEGGVTQFDRNPADLRDRTVVRFRRELVTKIVMHDPAAGPDVVLQKDAVDASADAWRVVAPRAGKAKVFKVTGVLWTLGSFKALAPGEEHPKDWGKYGLDAKAKSIAVFGEDGKELARLTIGKEVIGTPSGYWVRGTRDQALQSDGSRFGEVTFRLEDVLDEPNADAGVDAGAK
ncbi:MAG: DUF4340 domain-containing protein [Archangium sp.]